MLGQHLIQAKTDYSYLFSYAFARYINYEAICLYWILQGESYQTQPYVFYSYEDPAAELLISVAGSHQHSRKSSKTYAMAQNAVKQRFDPVLEFVDRSTVRNIRWKRITLIHNPLAEEIFPHV